MKRKLIITIVLVFGIVFLVNIQAQEPVSVLVIAIHGEAFIQSNSWMTPSILVVGQVVTNNDVILVELNSVVTLLCPDGSVLEIADYPGSPKCGTNVNEQLVFKWADLSLTATQRSNTDNVVYVISPRNTTLLNNRPTIKWRDHSTYTSPVTYSVELRLATGEQLWIVNDIKTTSLVYPENREPLRASDSTGKQICYQIVVTAFDQNGNVIPKRMDSGIFHDIRLIKPEDNVVNQSLNMIDNLSLPRDIGSEIRAFRKAQILFNSELYNDALSELESLILYPLTEDFPEALRSANDLTGSPTLYILLGDIFSKTGLPMEASQAYQRALLISETLNDFYSQTLVHKRLIPFGIDAQLHIDRAKEIYQKLNDVRAIEALDNELKSTPPPPTPSGCY